MAVLTVYSNQNVGATAEGEKLPSEVSLSTATGFYFVFDMLNEAVVKGFEGIELCWCTHYEQLVGGAVTAPEEFKDSYESKRIELQRRNIGDRKVYRSDVVLAKGPYAYVWLNVPDMGGIVDVTLRAITI